MKRKNMTSRQRVRLAINHKEADRIPLDLGSTLVTGIQASIYVKLKNALGVSKGDRSAPPSGKMPKGGYYFDTIVRQEPINIRANLKV